MSVIQLHFTSAPFPLMNPQTNCKELRVFLFGLLGERVCEIESGFLVKTNMLLNLLSDLPCASYSGTADRVVSKFVLPGGDSLRGAEGFTLAPPSDTS